MALLSLRTVSKSFTTTSGTRPVLRDVDLEVEEGDFVAIIGASGSGKTTLVSLIAGLMMPDGGVAELDGRPIVAPGPDRGVVFQNYSLLPWMSVLDNISLAIEAVAPSLPRAEIERQAERWIRVVNLGHALHKRPSELSGGMRQRVAVARGLAMSPKVLLLDEPFSALDALTRATLQDELARLWVHERKTIILITNDVEEAILLADRVYPLLPGAGATLGAPIHVPIPHPRSRRGLNSSAEYHHVRHALIAALTHNRERRSTRASEAIAA